MTGRVLLVGMMGTGKSTVGRAISRRTGWPYLDNDALLQQTTGLPAHELLARDGEPALRAAESAALIDVLRTPGSWVAGVATGVVLAPEARERLAAGGHVVWLRARLDTLVRRVAADPARPWLGEDPAEALAELAAVREPLLALVAAQVVDVDDLTPDQIAAAVLEGLGAQLARPIVGR